MFYWDNAGPHSSGPIHLAPAHRPSCQHLHICPGGPITGAFGLIQLILPIPVDTSCLLALLLWSEVACKKKPPVLCMFVFCTTSPHTGPIGGGRGGGGNLAVQLPSLSVISENIVFPNPAGDEGNRAGCLPRWNIGFCVLPISILQGPTLCDE